MSEGITCWLMYTVDLTLQFFNSSSFISLIPPSPTHYSATMTSTNNDDRPEILLSLCSRDYIDEINEHLINHLSQKATLKRVKEPAAANRFLDQHTNTNTRTNTTPQVIILTDEALAQREHTPILKKVLAYARAGGIVLAGLHFPSFTRPLDINSFSRGCGLPWQSGAYERTTFGVNPASVAVLPAEKHRVGSSGGDGTALAHQPYSMKALRLKNARPEERILVPVPGAVTQSMVFPSVSVGEGEAAVVGAVMGEGRFYYFGDMNAEVESTEVVLSLCGL